MVCGGLRWFGGGLRYFDGALAWCFNISQDKIFLNALTVCIRMVLQYLTG